MVIRGGISEIQDSEEEPLTSSPVNTLGEVMDKLITEAPALLYVSCQGNSTFQAHSELIDSVSGSKYDQAINQHNVSKIVEVSRMHQADMPTNTTLEQEETVAGQNGANSFDANFDRTLAFAKADNQSQTEESLNEAILDTALNDPPQQPASEVLAEDSERIVESKSNQTEHRGSLDKPQNSLMEAATDSLTLQRESRSAQMQSQDHVQEQTHHPELQKAPMISIVSYHTPSSDVARYAKATGSEPSKVLHLQTVDKPMAVNQIHSLMNESVEGSGQVQSCSVYTSSAEPSWREEPLAAHDTEQKAFGRPAIGCSDTEIPQTKAENTRFGSMEVDALDSTIGLIGQYHVASRIDTSGSMGTGAEVGHAIRNTNNVNPGPRDEKSSKPTWDDGANVGVVHHPCEDWERDSRVQAGLTSNQVGPVAYLSTHLARNQGEKSPATRSKKGTSTPTYPSSLQSPQDVTLAELKAQKTALLTSLAALPAIQVLIEEIAAAQSDLVVNDDEPSESDTMAAANKIVKDHIKLLHEYNELKDIGQGLMGLIADQRGVRIVEVQNEFGIDGND